MRKARLRAFRLLNDTLADIRALTSSLLLVLFVSPTFLFPGCFAQSSFYSLVTVCYSLDIRFARSETFAVLCCMTFGNNLDLLSPT